MIPLSCVTLRCAPFHGVTVARTQSTISESNYKMHDMSILHLKADVAKWQTQRT